MIVFMFKQKKSEYLIFSFLPTDYSVVYSLSLKISTGTIPHPQNY